MKIKSKLFLLTIVPAISMLLFSLNHILTVNTKLEEQRELLTSAELINTSSNLLYKFQYERGLSSSLLNTKNEHFKDLLQKHYKSTDQSIELFNLNFKNLDDHFLSISNKHMLLDITEDFASLLNLRKSILKLEIRADDSFSFYTHLNDNLLEIIKHIGLYSTDKKTHDLIEVFKLLISFRENAGQERALFVNLYNGQVSDENLRLYYNLIDAQNKKLEELSHNHKYHSLKKEQSFQKYIDQIRTNVRKDNIKKVDIKKWIQVSTQRIDYNYEIEKKIFLKIKQQLRDKAIKLNYEIYINIIFTLILLTIFLFVAYQVSTNIINSIKRLNTGLFNFFEYLNFKTDSIKEIEVQANDEIAQMSKGINKQIKQLHLNIKEDTDFINETTEIANLMKNGNFSEHVYYEPSNPYLLQLKVVFNELVDLITNKIKEQTSELETLNYNLEDKVFQQTLEIETKLKQALEAEKAKGNFLASMSHEIRTPLNAILGFVKILQKNIKDKKDLGYLEIINSSGVSLLSIINDILDFSKIQNGKFEINPIEIDLMAELSITTTLFASKCYEKHIIYAVYIDPNLPKTIKVDDTRVKQILSNVLSNAIKFTPRDGMVKVSINIENSVLSISVQDSGIGIAKENMGKIFSAFEQADGTTTRKYGGTGLGLSISSKLAKLMDGTLSVSSTFAKGSIFTLTIPVESVDDSPKELLNLQKINHYKFAILKHGQSNIFSRLITQYLSDFGITNVKELESYENDGYDILFFVPHDDYNEDIVENKRPAIAMLRSDQIKLADIEHITSLYAPFAPTSVIQAIDDITAENIQEIQNNLPIEIAQEDEEVFFTGNVLVVEDNKTNQMLIKLILMDYELDYEIANDGVEAVKMFKEGKYDLVLMDENMPNLNGLGALEQILEYEKGNSLTHTPVVALTANALVSDVERFLAAGMDGFVAKPIDNDLLQDELGKFLKRI